LKSPSFLFLKVVLLALSLGIFLISILLRPILAQSKLSKLSTLVRMTPK
jgi:hypothetical protein